MKILKLLLFLFLTVNLYAVKYSELASEDYTLKVGLDDQAKVSGDKKKQDIEKIPVKPDSKKTESQKDLTDAYILSHIQNAFAKNKSDETPQAKSLLELPQSYQDDVKQIVASANNQNNTNLTSNAGTVSKLLLVRCETDKDYKVNNTINLNLYCKELKNKNGKLYKLRANATVSNTNNKITLIAKPYLLEDEMGVTYTIEQEKSKMYNTLSGDENIATYVDRKAVESIAKSMATTAATEGPKLSKDYLDKKTASSSTVIQNDNTTTTASNTPKPDAGDYGISFLLSVISSGIKAGVDQLYMDLGYVYFIPKGSAIDSELFIVVND